ncbi:MAG: hypothetical protein LJE62_10545 [Silicimonas sp.]|nr:hypothetical protein [Silicimonas sp.]
MKSKALQIFCWLALGVTALGAFFVASSGSFYSSGAEGEAPYLFFAMAPPILIALLLVLLRRARHGPVQFLTMIVSGAVGLILTGLMVYNLIFYTSDWLLYTPPLLLGIGLLALAFEPALRGRS